MDIGPERSAWPAGGGEMGARMRAHDWAATPLGPVEGWPQSLKTAAGIMLGTRHPVGIFWGPDLACLYNDAYAASLGPEQHPSSLGVPAREAWPEAYPLVASELAQVMAGGEASWRENRLVPIRRRGRLEEVHWTYSHGPIPEPGAPNGVGGVLTLITETTPAVAALRESEERLSMALDAARMGTFDYDPASDRLEITARSAQLFGLPPGATLPTGEAASGLFHPEARERHRAAFLEASRPGESYRTEYRVVRPRDGRVVWIEERGSTVADPATGRARVRGIHWDVTERKETEARLRESEERFRALAEAIEDVFYMTDLDRGALLYLSPSYERVWGRPAAELLADLSGFEATIHPDDRPAFHAAKAAQARGEPVAAEYRVLRPDGAARWVFDRSFPVPGGPGRRAAGVASDVTDRKEAEARLRESEERFRQFGEASSDLLWIRDAGTLRFEYLSPAFEALFGAGREAVLAGGVERWAELIHPDDRERALANLGRVRAGERVAYEARIVRPANGGVRWAANTAFPLPDAHGRVRRLAGIAADVTERKEAADRLGVLVAELQHRTRNLLAVVRAVADRTLAGSASLDDFRERFRARLAALARVNGLLSRLDEGERVTFDELIRAELSGHGAVDESGRGPQVALDGPRGVRLRSATVQTFALALHELATNAVKYGALSRPEGRLRVCWRPVEADGGERRLRVEWIESGVPVPPPPDEHPPRKGYGRELIERALPYQLNAQTRYELGPDGVRCTITLPVSAERAMGGLERADDDCS